MKKVPIALLAILLLCSHDLFLKMDGHFIPPNTNATIKLFNGTFERSENVIARNRMLDVSLVGHGQRTKVDTTAWYEKDSITFLKFRSGKEGTWLAGVSTASRNIALPAADFNSYLEHDGVLDMLQWRSENNAMDTDAVERYSKHVKTLFQVGEKLTDDWKTVLGYPIEFVPLENPYDIHPGHSLRFKLLLQGKPLQNQLVYVGNDHSGQDHAHEEASNKEHAHEDGTVHTHDEVEPVGETHEHTGVQQLRTDENGEVTVSISGTGVWYLRTIYMEQVEEEGLTHESNWATLTFAIGDGHSHEHGEEAHDHVEDGLPSYSYWIGSLVLVGLLFFWFNRKK